MGESKPAERSQAFRELLASRGIGLAYFFGSQKELGPRLLYGEEVAGAPDSDLDLGVVLLEHPPDWRESQKLRQTLEELLAPLFAPVRLHLLLLEEENAHVQYAAIRGLPAYVPDDAFARLYRSRVLTAYGDWYNWWP